MRFTLLLRILEYGTSTNSSMSSQLEFNLTLEANADSASLRRHRSALRSAAHTVGGRDTPEAAVSK